MSITNGGARNQSENTFCYTFRPKLKFYACQLSVVECRLVSIDFQACNLNGAFSVLKNSFREITFAIKYFLGCRKGVATLLNVYLLTQLPSGHMTFIEHDIASTLMRRCHNAVCSLGHSSF